MGKNRLKEIEEASLAVLEAEQSYRNAKILLQSSYVSLVEMNRSVLDKAPASIEEAILLVAGKEAADALELYVRDPERFAYGRTFEQAWARSLKIARGRYRGGKCRLCTQDAFECAKRHAKGRSCQ